jgi:multidrug resistance efflux pump
MTMFAMLAVLMFIGLATLRWGKWVGRSSVQTTNDAYVRAQNDEIE